MTALGEACVVVAGQSPEGTSYNNKANGEPFYQGKKEFGDRYIGPATTWTTSATKLAEDGDILMSVRAPVGPVNILRGRACIGRGLAAIRPRPGINRDFIYYQLLAMQQQIAGTEGAVFASINKGQIEALDVWIPDLDEQKRIVEKLHTVTTLGNLLQDKASLEQVRSEDLRQRLTVELMESSGPLIDLGDLCDVLDSKRQPITKKDRVPGPIPYYGATGIVDFVQDFIFDEDLVLLGEDGAKWGPGDRSAFAISGRTWVNNHAHVLRPDRKVVRDQWLIEYLNAADLEEYVTGLTVPKLNQAQMRSIPVPVPTLAVQDDILGRLKSVSEAAGRLGEVAAARKAQARELLQSVLEAAFRGEF